jgi:hypothetical protein
MRNFVGQHVTQDRRLWRVVPPKQRLHAIVENHDAGAGIGIVFLVKPSLRSRETGKGRRRQWCASPPNHPEPLRTFQVHTARFFWLCGLIFASRARVSGRVPPSFTLHIGDGLTSIGVVGNSGEDTGVRVRRGLCGRSQKVTYGR